MHDICMQLLHLESFKFESPMTHVDLFLSSCQRTCHVIEHTVGFHALCKLTPHSWWLRVQLKCHDVDERLIKLGDQDSLCSWGVSLHQWWDSGHLEIAAMMPAAKGKPWCAKKD